MERQPLGRPDPRPAAARRRPLPADEIVETLAIARSNVSSSIKELQTYQLVDLTHIPGDRRDHFTARPDPWDMLLAIVEERKRRELDPTIEMLRACAADAETDRATPQVARTRLAGIRDFVGELDLLDARLLRLPRPRLRRLLKLGDRIIRTLQR